MAEKEAAPEEGKEGSGNLEAELAAKKKGPSKKVLIMIILGGLLLVGAGVGGALLFTGGEHKEAAAEKHEAEAEKTEKASGEAVKPAFFPLGDLLVNLSGEGKRPSYLKVKISLELVDSKDLSSMESLKPRIIDNFQVYLRELRVEDLRGSAGLYRLREALLLRVTEAAQPVRIRDVLFQEMLIQ